MIFIGNPHGGAGHKGEVYVFTLLDNKWQQTDLLLPGNIARGFGKSITVNDKYLVIGNPSTGEADTPVFHSGSVFVYARENSAWQQKLHLVPKGRPKGISFGRRVLLKNGDNPSLLIQSAKDIYRYDLSPNPSEISAAGTRQPTGS